MATKMISFTDTNGNDVAVNPDNVRYVHAGTYGNINSPYTTIFFEKEHFIAVQGSIDGTIRALNGESYMR